MARELSSPEASIVADFRRAFGELAGERVILYGIGAVTRLLLSEIPDLPVVGLLDPGAVGQHLYGHQVLSLDDALAMQPSRIVIVARESSTRIIRRRIAASCDAAGVPLFDVTGRRLLEPSREELPHDPYWDLTQDAVKEAIDRASSVSFDLFETLLTRPTLTPSDAWELVGERMVERGVADFARLRAQAQAQADSDGAATLAAIYQQLQALSGLDDEVIAELRELELQVERSLLVRREAMVELFDHAVARRLPVTLVAQTPLPEEFVRSTLQALDIAGFDQLVLSGDSGCGTPDALFSFVSQREPGHQGHHLHIGDHPEVDGAAAQAAGATTVLIRSGLDLLRHSPGASVLEAAETLSDRLAIGLAVCTVFNNPFVTSTTQGRIPIGSARDLARLVLAPVMIGLTEWVLDEARHLDLEVLLLAARDGFLPHQLAELWDEHCRQQGHSPPSGPRLIYFLTSRVAASLASIRDAADIDRLAGLHFSGTAHAMLTSRFLLDETELDPDSAETHLEAARSHSALILAHSRRARENYQAYVDSLGLPRRTTVGLFDFVSSGTAQLGLQTLLEQPVVGLYCLRIMDPRPERQALVVHARSVLDHEHDRRGGLNASYVFLENFLSAPQPMLRGFGPGGVPLYCAESRTDAELSDMNEVHDEVRTYFTQWLQWRCHGSHDSFEAPSLAVTDALLGLINSRCVALAPGLFEGHAHVDEFLNVSSSWLDAFD